MIEEQMTLTDYESKIEKEKKIFEKNVREFASEMGVFVGVEQ
jgi:hypothetical protein